MNSETINVTDVELFINSIVRKIFSLLDYIGPLADFSHRIDGLHLQGIYRRLTIDSVGLARINLIAGH